MTSKFPITGFPVVQPTVIQVTGGPILSTLRILTFIKSSATSGIIYVGSPIAVIWLTSSEFTRLTTASSAIVGTKVSLDIEHTSVANGNQLVSNVSCSQGASYSAMIAADVHDMKGFLETEVLQQLQSLNAIGSELLDLLKDRHSLDGRPSSRSDFQEIGQGPPGPNGTDELESHSRANTR